MEAKAFSMTKDGGRVRLRKTKVTWRIP